MKNFIFILLFAVFIFNSALMYGTLNHNNDLQNYDKVKLINAETNRTDSVFILNTYSIEVETEYMNDTSAVVYLTNISDSQITIESNINFRNDKNNCELENVAFINLNSSDEQGVATDGYFLYTSSANGYEGYDFAKYTLDGEFIEGFSIEGVSGIEDLSFDGHYFYGGNSSNILYKLDLSNKSLISEITTEVPVIKHCTYYKIEDCFFVGSSNSLYKISRNGAILKEIDAVDNITGTGLNYYSAYSPCLYVYSYNHGRRVYFYSLDTYSIAYCFHSVDTDDPQASGGGLFIGQYKGNMCLFANVKQEPNIVAIYDIEDYFWLYNVPYSITLNPNETKPVNLYFNGYWTEEGSVNTSCEFNVVRPLNIQQAVVLDITFNIINNECFAPYNVIAEYENNYIELSWNIQQQLSKQYDDLQGYNIYVNGLLISTINDPNITTYTGKVDYSDDNFIYVGVSALYNNCESEINYVDINLGMFKDNDIIIYPNPVKQILHIDGLFVKKVYIYNNLGQLIMEVNESNEIDVSQIPDGIYILNIISNENSHRKIKIMIQN